MSDDPRITRIAQNEVIFREVNERIAESAERFAVPDTADFACECGHGGCAEMVSMGLDAYEAVRANPRRFAVVPGHEIEDAEEVVERHDAYTVVEKTVGAGSAIAEALDPRRRE